MEDFLITADIPIVSADGKAKKDGKKAFPNLFYGQKKQGYILAWLGHHSENFFSLPNEEKQAHQKAAEEKYAAGMSHPQAV